MEGPENIANVGSFWIEGFSTYIPKALPAQGACAVQIISQNVGSFPK